MLCGVNRLEKAQVQGHEFLISIDKKVMFISTFVFAMKLNTSQSEPWCHYNKQLVMVSTHQLNLKQGS